MLTSLQILQRARDLLSDKARWCSGAYALDEHGNVVISAEPLEFSHACQWCGLGALFAVSEPGADRASWEAEQKLNHAAGEIASEAEASIIYLNDYSEYGYDAVIEAYDKAITEEKSHAV